MFDIDKRQLDCLYKLENCQYQTCSDILPYMTGTPLCSEHLRSVLGLTVQKTHYSIRPDNRSVFHGPMLTVAPGVKHDEGVTLLCTRNVIDTYLDGTYERFKINSATEDFLNTELKHYSIAYQHYALEVTRNLFEATTSVKSKDENVDKIAEKMKNYETLLGNDLMFQRIAQKYTIQVLVEEEKLAEEEMLGGDKTLGEEKKIGEAVAKTYVTKTRLLQDVPKTLAYLLLHITPSVIDIPKVENVVFYPHVNVPNLAYYEKEGIKTLAPLYHNSSLVLPSHALNNANWDAIVTKNIPTTEILTDKLDKTAEKIWSTAFHVRVHKSKRLKGECIMPSYSRHGQR